MKKIIPILILLIVPFWGFSQSKQDMAKAKEEVAPVYDLGKLFIVVLQMETNDEELRLNQSQLEIFYEELEKIKKIKRFEPSEAEKMLLFFEDEVLSEDQLAKVDDYLIKRQEEMAQRPKGEMESGGGKGQKYLKSWMNGKAFNPLLDKDMDAGKAFWELAEYVAQKIGK